MDPFEVRNARTEGSGEQGGQTLQKISWSTAVKAPSAKVPLVVHILIWIRSGSTQRSRIIRCLGRDKIGPMAANSNEDSGITQSTRKLSPVRFE